MKKQGTKLLLFLGLLSLITIAAVVTLKAVKERSIRKNAPVDITTVLGETVEFPLNPENKQKIDQVVQNTIQSTKETVSEKIVEVEKIVTETLEKEISNLTTSQVETLKL